jgi:hypothetical protein
LIFQRDTSKGTSTVGLIVNEVQGLGPWRGLGQSPNL